MEIIRLATPEEIEKIKDVADLTRASSVVVHGKGLAVLRQVLEADPIIFQEDATLTERYTFLFALANGLAMTGVPEVYFNIHADDEKHKAVYEKAGCITTSTAPEFRLKKVLR